MTLGERIKKMRKGKYTQAELVEVVEVYENTIRRWELGERTPDADALSKIAVALGVTVSELMGEQGDFDLYDEGERVSLKKNVLPITRSNKWMLVYERDGERMELPPTEEGYSIMNDIAKAIVNRRPNVDSHVSLALAE